MLFFFFINIKKSSSSQSLHTEYNYAQLCVYVLVSDLIAGYWTEIFGLSNLYMSHNKGVSNGKFGQINPFVL
jgi:hypothetical protein